MLASGTTFHVGDTLTPLNTPSSPPFRRSTVAQAELAVNAGLKDAADAHRDRVPASTRTIGVQITRPSMVLTKTASTTGGVAPQNVTYTYTLKNTGDSDIRNVRVSDDLCSPLDLGAATPTATACCRRPPRPGGRDVDVHLQADLPTAGHVHEHRGGDGDEHRGQPRGHTAGPAHAEVTVTAPPPPRRPAG